MTYAEPCPPAGITDALLLTEDKVEAARVAIAAPVTEKNSATHAITVPADGRLFIATTFPPRTPGVNPPAPPSVRT